MSLSEIETLRRLRRHRADRAERALREAKRQQRALQASIEKARIDLEHTRQQESQQCADLLSQHQGQVVSFQALKSWAAEERTLCAETQREEVRLQGLQGQQATHVATVDTAQKQVSECLRQVEKLQELSTLLVQEQT